MPKAVCLERLSGAPDRVKIQPLGRQARLKGEDVSVAQLDKVDGGR